MRRERVRSEWEEKRLFLFCLAKSVEGCRVQLPLDRTRGS